MNEPKLKWKDLIIMRKSRLFVGRQNILERFRLNCLDSVPRDLITVLKGISGIGKSITVTRLREIAHEYGIFTTYVDRGIDSPVQKKVILRFMCSVSQQFSSLGNPLTQFDERYQEYVSALHQIDEDVKAPTHPFDVIGGLDDEDSWYQQMWDTYLQATFSTNTCTLVQHPVEQLTPIFMHDLNTWALVRRILLCIDDWQLLEKQMGIWLRSLMFEGELSTRIWMMLATRDDLSTGWDHLSPLIMLHELTEFTENEVRTYFRTKGVSDVQRASDIIAFSDGLPVLVDLLSSVKGGIAGDLALSPIDRYFKWLSNTERRVVLLASVARYIDVPILDSILGRDGEKWFEWLKNASLLTQKGEFWVYHSFLRPQILSWARREMYGATYAAHVALRAYFLSLESEDESQLRVPNESVNTSTIESIYHGLMIGESGALRYAILSFIHLVRNDYTLAGELVRTFEQVTNAQENTNAVVEWTVILKKLWEAFCTGNWEYAISCCEEILQREVLDADVKSAIELLIKAIQARFPHPSLISTSETKELEDKVIIVSDTILSEINEEVREEPEVVTNSINPHLDTYEEILKSHQRESVVSVGQIKKENLPSEIKEKGISFQTAEEWCDYGDTKLRQELFADSLEAYTQALGLEPTLLRAFLGQATVYTRLDDFTSAIERYSEILVIDPQNVMALRHRGWLHVRQRHYVQALKDYDRAVNLAPDDVALVCARANVYYRLKDYTNALKGYDEAIRRESKYVEAYLNRGVTHAVLHEYRRAIADFNQVISLDPNNGYAFHRRGRALTKLQQYDLALKDYNQALEFIPHVVAIYIDLGLLYTRQSEYSKAFEAYQLAIAQDPDNSTAYYNAACVAALMGNVEEVYRKLDTAIKLHPPYREMATTDIDFSSIRHTPEFQKRIKKPGSSMNNKE